MCLNMVELILLSCRQTGKPKPRRLAQISAFGSDPPLENLQQAPVADPARVECDLNRLGVSRRAAADHVVPSGVRGTIGIVRDGAGDLIRVLKDALHTPEATTGEHGGFEAPRLLCRLAERV